MPYIHQEVEAEILLEYKGFTVYYTYNHGEFEDPTSNFYSFTADEDDPEFDVRELHNFGVKYGDKEYRKPEYHTREYHRDIVREAIEHGHLDDVIRASGLDTLKEQEWKEDYRTLQRWQLLELLIAYDKALIEAHQNNRPGGTLSAFYTVFRKGKIK